MAARRVWLVKSEPFKYAWSQLVADGRTVWDGVRNFEARNNLRAMRVGDLALFYHSNEGREIVGLAEIVRAAYPDPTSEEDWSVVDLAPVVALARPVPLDLLKHDRLLRDMAVVRRSRLSVTPVTAAELDRVLALGETRRPGRARAVARARPRRLTR
jgi:predicted RNA-binding protein with PUA-like domain